MDEDEQGDLDPTRKGRDSIALDSERAVHEYSVLLQAELPRYIQGLSTPGKNGMKREDYEGLKAMAPSLVWDNPAVDSEGDDKDEDDAEWDGDGDT
ncbi:hypothetical protein FRB93_013491 [Tulasnella sp. JGI-2019a]|nr:hypothetical protein FRB93_013491 [Tulasnella sp. JGI-2019a]